MWVCKALIAQFKIKKKLFFALKLLKVETCKKFKDFKGDPLQISNPNLMKIVVKSQAKKRFIEKEVPILRLKTRQKSSIDRLQIRQKNSIFQDFIFQV